MNGQIQGVNGQLGQLLTSSDWHPLRGEFGFLPFILGTLWVTALAMVLAVPPCLLGGIVALALLELPILVRAMDEVVSMVPFELQEASYALGATRLETALRAVLTIIILTISLFARLLARRLTRHVIR